MMYSGTIHKDLRINSYGAWLRHRFGCRVSKVTVDGGFTCPNRDGSKGFGGCIFCDNASFSPDGSRADLPVEAQLATGMAYHRCRLGSEKFIVYFQKFTNTYAPVARLASLFHRALAHPDVVGISVGTRPDALSDETVALLTDLARSHYVCVELGLQSMDEVTLAWMNRGHGLDDYLLAVDRLSGRNIALCTHLIYGFPGDTRQTLLNAADVLAALPIGSLKIHQLHAVAGTRLAELYHAGSFQPVAFEEYVGAVGDFLERLPAAVAIQRLYGSAPLAIRVAPNWNLKNNQMWYAIVNELKRRGSWQGCRLSGGWQNAGNF